MKTVGWIFIGVSLLGCFLFLSYVADWGVMEDDIMAPGLDGGASNAPIMIGLIALAGACLPKASRNGSQ